MKNKTQPTYAWGTVIKKTCKICGKQRLCRMDKMSGYYTAESSQKLIPVCIYECSRYTGSEG